MFNSSKSFLILSLSRLLAERLFRRKTGCGEGGDGRHDSRGNWRERERSFILSDKERSWIGVYHTFNWTPSLCLAGLLEVDDRNVPAGTETVDIPQLTVISHNLCLSLALTLQARFCLGFLSPPPCLLLFLSLLPLVCPWLVGFLVLFSISASNFCLPSLHFSCSVPLYILSSAYIPLCPLFLSIIALVRIACILVCFFFFFFFSPACCPALIGRHSRHHAVYI